MLCFWLYVHKIDFIKKDFAHEFLKAIEAVP